MMSSLFFWLFIGTLAFASFITAEEDEEDNSDFNSCFVRERAYYTFTNALGKNLAFQFHTDPPDLYITLVTNGEYEQFSFQRIPYGVENNRAYAIKTKGNHSYALTSNDDEIKLEIYKAQKNQMFRLVPTSHVYCALQVLSSEKFVGFEQNSDSSKIILKEYPNTDGKSTHWQINKMHCDPYPYQPYRIVQANSYFVIGLDPDQLNNNDSLKFLGGEEKGYHAQVTFERDSELAHLHHIIMRHSNKEVVEPHSNSQFQVIQYTRGETDNGKWQVETATKYCVIRSFKHQELVHQDEFGALIHATSNPGNSGFYFEFHPIGFAPEPKKPYRIRNIYTKLYLGVESATATAGNPILQTAYAASNAGQLWEFIQHGQKTYQYHLRLYQHALDIQIPSDQQAAATLETPSDSNQQLFEIDDVIGNFRLRANNFALSTADSSPNNILARDGDAIGARQLWKFEVDV